ncbi:MAG: 3-phosphoshikimate 1-carboxyvinyltransferase [Prevotella sp.]|nr:3-phosphoshikimate 1-carboxyvinyltransferase [Staphylococcus sp.]MCM1350403.1 3-phosphoshikimate 1-carboxyvinyltransferase [Prevotella sp.]
MKVTITKSQASGTIVAPPSKSYAHRVLIVSMLTDKPCTIYNIDLSQDILATLHGLEIFGKTVNCHDGIVEVQGKILLDNLPNHLYLDCMESGSTLRFFIPILLLTGKTITLKGTTRLIERGIREYQTIFQKQGIQIKQSAEDITLHGQLKSDHFILAGNISSQFITGLLFALPLLPQESTITLTTQLESKPYVDMTLDVLRLAGIVIEEQENSYHILGNQCYFARDYQVEGDYSNAAFLDAFNYLGGSVRIQGLNPYSKQGDRLYATYFPLLSQRYASIDIGNCIDLGPILFCFSALMHGGHFTHTSRLKIKESNRIEAVKKELAKCGVSLIEGQDEVWIDNTHLRIPEEELDGWQDHRIVMALSVLLSRLGGSIYGADAVRKSYPRFFDDLIQLGIEVRQDDRST